jgi:hypothetical protein
MGNSRLENVAYSDSDVAIGSGQDWRINKREGAKEKSGILDMGRFDSNDSPSRIQRAWP